MDTMRSAQPDEPNVTDGGRRSAAGLVLLAWAGIAGPVLFTAAFLLQEVRLGSEYSRIAEPVSALAAGPNGWVQDVNFAIFGVLTLAFAVGLHRGVQPTRHGWVGPAVIALSGIGLLLAAAFPLRQDAAGAIYDPGGHIVAGLTFFLSSAVGLIVVARRLARDSRWRSITRYTLACGVIALVAFVVGGRLVMADGGALHAWAGAYQRVLILTVIFPCRVALSLRLLRIAHRHAAHAVNEYRAVA